MYGLFKILEPKGVLKTSMTTTITGDHFSKELPFDEQSQIFLYEVLEKNVENQSGCSPVGKVVQWNPYIQWWYLLIEVIVVQ